MGALPWRGAGAAMRFRLCCACGSFASGGNRSCMHACQHVTMPAHTLQYIHRIRNSSIELLLGTHAGCSGRPPPYNGTLMHDSAQTHTHTHTHIKCETETCGSTDSSGNLGSCGAVLSLQEARQQTRLYHSMLYVPVSVQAALVQKGEPGRPSRLRCCDKAEAQRGPHPMGSTNYSCGAVAFRPSVPAACILPARKAMLLWRAR